MFQRHFRWDRLAAVIGWPILAIIFFGAIFGTFYGIGFGLSHFGNWPSGSIHTLRVFAGVGVIGLIIGLFNIVKVMIGVCEWFYEPKEGNNGR